MIKPCKYKKVVLKVINEINERKRTSCFEEDLNLKE